MDCKLAKFYSSIVHQIEVNFLQSFKLGVIGSAISDSSHPWLSIILFLIWRVHIYFITFISYSKKNTFEMNDRFFITLWRRMYAVSEEESSAKWLPLPRLQDRIIFIKIFINKFENGCLMSLKTSRIPSMTSWIDVRYTFSFTWPYRKKQHDVRSQDLGH